MPTLSVSISFSYKLSLVSCSFRVMFKGLYFVCYLFPVWYCIALYACFVCCFLLLSWSDVEGRNFLFFYWWWTHTVWLSSSMKKNMFFLLYLVLCSMSNTCLQVATQTNKKNSFDLQFQIDCIMIALLAVNLIENEADYNLLVILSTCICLFSMHGCVSFFTLK